MCLQLNWFMFGQKHSFLCFDDRDRVCSTSSVFKYISYCAAHFHICVNNPLVR